MSGLLSGLGIVLRVSFPFLTIVKLDSVGDTKATIWYSVNLHKKRPTCKEWAFYYQNTT